MKIISLNAWHGTRDRELRGFLVDHIDSTDVFCFQESDGEKIERLFNDLLPESLFQRVGSIKTNIPTPDSLTTFVRKEIEIVHDRPLMGEDTGEMGYAYLTQLRRASGDEATIVNVHGVPLPGDKLDTPGRIRQSKVIIDTIAEYDGLKIVCGDFNLDPSTESVNLFHNAGYSNLIDDYDIPTTRNELAWQKYPDNKQLFADYVFVSADVAVDGFTVPQNLVSDHLPMIIEIHEDGVVGAQSQYASHSNASLS